MNIELNMKQKLGFGLFILSCILFVLIPVVPFLPLSFKEKALAAAALVVVGDTVFWVGGLLLGKELLSRFKFWEKDKVTYLIAVFPQSAQNEAPRA